MGPVGPMGSKEEELIGFELEKKGPLDELFSALLEETQEELLSELLMNSLEELGTELLETCLEELTCTLLETLLEETEEELLSELLMCSEEERSAWDELLATLEDRFDCWIRNSLSG